jgi:hypothetical protein
MRSSRAPLGSPSHTGSEGLAPVHHRGVPKQHELEPGFGFPPRHAQVKGNPECCGLIHGPDTSQIAQKAIPKMEWNL